MTLSALSGSAVGGTVLGVAYVFGMTFPLFVLALAWDRLQLSERRRLTAKPVHLRLAGRTVVTNTVNVGVAIGFAVMGGFVIYLANTGRMTGGPGPQVAVGRLLARVFGRIESWLAPVPEPVLGVALVALAAVFVIATLAGRPGHSSAEEPAGGQEEAAAADDETSVPLPACHTTARHEPTGADR